MDIMQNRSKVLEQLVNVYGRNVEYETIYSIAANCRFHFGRSSVLLDKISSNNVRMASGASFSSSKNSPVHVTRSMTNSKFSHFNQVTEQIKRGYRVLVILRGLPGSGKSYLARKIVEITVGSQNYHEFIFSADDYFIRRGTYQYDPTKISDAHTFNQQRAFDAMKNGVSPIIIDNTNTQMWEMKPYAMVAAQYAYIIEILEPDAPWAFDEKELSRKNKHGVPRVKLRDMLTRYEKNITREKVIRTFNIRYQQSVPPLMRLYPPLVEKKVNNFEEKLDNKIEIRKEEQKPSVDDMLSHFDNTTVTLLKPSVQESKPKEFNSAVPDADLSLWGVSETALHSWDICIPTATKQMEDIKEASGSEVSFASSLLLETCEAATNTCAKDFLLLAHPKPDVKILLTNCRDINEFHHSAYAPVVRKKIVVDKSSMVGEDLIDHQLEKKDALEQLNVIFPSIPNIYVREIYDKCQGDINWTIDLLCDENLHNVVIPHEQFQQQKMEEHEQNSTFDETTKGNDEMELVGTVVKEVNTVDVEAERENLKRLLEEKVVIRDDFYSEHTLKLKSKTTPTCSNSVAQPSTSKIRESSTDLENVIAVDSDFDMDEFDLETASESTASGSDTQEMMELNLGDVFVSELENKLQETTLQYPKGFLPIVQVPVALARQLYALYIESVYQQMDAQNEVLDMLVKEDEELAKKLQAQEIQSTTPRPSEPATIPEIMQEQHELNLCQREVEQWKNLTPDDFAAKMTKKKLFESFPYIAQDVLVEIWQAHDNNYKETVESILASSPNCMIESNGKIEDPPVSKETVEEMRVAYDQQEMPEDNYENKTALSYREDAARHLENRKMLYQKAMQAYQRGMTEVAIYYSSLAKKQTELYDQANNLAASSFLTEHSEKHQNYDTLDLHFLYVKEAIAALDMFLDNSVHLLKGTNKKQYLFIITGRGKRSANGVSKIKPAVKARLQKRKINYVQINPGLLKVKVTERTLITTDLPENK